MKWLAAALASLGMYGIWAFLLAWSRRYAGSPYPLMVVHSIGALACACLMWAVASLRERQSYSTSGLYLAASAGVCAMLGNLFLIVALGAGGAARAGRTLMLTALYPLVAVLLTWAVWGDDLTWSQRAGVLLGGVALLLLAK